MMSIYHKLTASDYLYLDPNIRRLVRQLNALPGIYTLGSCGGHEQPNEIQKPIGEWFVSFVVAITQQQASKSLSLIANVPNNMGVKLVNVDVSSDGVGDWRALWFSIYGIVKDGQCSDPRQAAAVILQLRKQENMLKYHVIRVF